ncbi:glycosyltransferase family 4 protein [Parabacteroides sp. OttesenSCG-928-J18]|nr:glycosyltransferase family 4 protein [Parabacteroides sp. OttesenSCG-928-J18]
MKVLQINKYFYRKGGSETVFFNIMDLLEEHHHTVIPFSIRNNKNISNPYDSFFVDYAELSESGFITKIKNLPSFFYNRRAAKQLEILIQKEKPDMAHIHLVFNSLSVAILPVLKKHNIPVIMSVHDFRLICPAYLFMDGEGNMCEQCLTKKSYLPCMTKKCSKGSFFNSASLALDSYLRKYVIPITSYIDHFLFVSHFSRKKHIEADYRYENKSSALYNFTPIQKDPGITKENYILYFGRVSGEKGIATLMQAMEGLPETKLKIIGSGPLLEEYAQKKYKNIEFLGYKTGKELENYIQRALFVVVPSECYENNPLSIVESFALGTPVIGSRIGGIPELIRENENGFLFEPKSVTALQETLRKATLLSDKDYEDLCEGALAFAHKYFTKEAYYQELINIYNQVLNTNENRS